MIGTTAGSYRITSVLSVGGMGTVYRAEHSLIGRIAAVKVLHPEMTASKDIVQRFFNEAKATTSIKHPGIVEIYDYGHLESGHAYLVMEFLEGRTLNARNKQRKPISEGEAAAVLRGVCGALAAAHAKGIVHRDLKPDNIFLVPDPDSVLGERPKLLDFGIAKLTDIGLAGSATKTGAVMGTPTYMSPEQCKGTGDVDHRADLYSLGCIFYEMVTGRPPFTNAGAGELIGAHLFMQPQPPSKLGVSLTPDAEQLIMALLAKDPADRPQTAVELSNLLVNIAVRGGFGTATNWERASMPAMGMHTPIPGTRPPTYDASDAPTQFTPAHLTPGGSYGGAYPAPSGSPMPLPAPPPTPFPPPGFFNTPDPRPRTPYAGVPTPATGSLATGTGTNVDHLTPAPMPTMAPAGGKKWILGVAAVAVIGGIAAIVLAMGGKPDEPKPAPSTTVEMKPTPTTVEMTPTPTPTEHVAAPTPPPPMEATPPVEAPPPVEAKPEPVATPPQPEPVATPKAPTPKTPKTPKQPKHKTGSDPLLETDL